MTMQTFYENVLHHPHFRRKLAWWSFRRDALAHGRNVQGWHWTNVALHLICITFVYAILYGFWPTGAFLGACAFAFHPAATSSVASISGRFSLMCAAFYFAALLCVIIGGWAWLAVTPLVYGAWLSKEEFVMFPVVAVVTLIVVRLI